MANIYAHAYVTVTTTHGADPDCGIPNLRNNKMLSAGIELRVLTEK
jgi:hypothetical protein